MAPESSEALEIASHRSGSGIRGSLLVFFRRLCFRRLPCVFLFSNVCLCFVEGSRYHDAY